MMKLILKFVIFVNLITICAFSKDFEQIEILLPEFADKVGNGGDAVVCRDKKFNITSIELLDLFEGEAIRGFVPKMKSRSSLAVNIDMLLKRLSFFDIYLKEKVEADMLDFMNHARFIKGVQLPDINDSNHIVVPKSCFVEQIAIQKEPEFVQDRLFTINQDLWDLMDNANKAALMLHEVVYRNVIKNNVSNNSLSTRYFVSLVASDNLKNYSYKGYLNFISKKLGYEKTNYKGDEISIRDLLFYDNNNIKSYRIYFDLDTKIDLESQEIALSEGSQIEYELFKDKSIKSIKIYMIAKSGTLTILGHDFSYGNRIELTYNENGKVKKISTDKQLKIFSFFNKNNEGFILCDDIIFDSNQKLVCNSRNIFTSTAQIDLKWIKHGVYTFIRYPNSYGYQGNAKLVLSKELKPESLDLNIEFKDADLNQNHDFKFFSNGSIESIFTESGHIDFNYDPKSNNNLSLQKGQTLSFYDSGIVKSGGYKSFEFKNFKYPVLDSSDHISPIFTSVYGKELCTGFDSEYRAYPNGNPEFVIPKKYFKFIDLPLVSGELSYATSTDIVLLDPSGNVYNILRQKCKTSF